MSKIKELLIPRFQTITELIDKVQVLAKQNPQLDNRIRDLGERNNLLNSDLIRHNIAKGLVYLRDEGWLSDKECSGSKQQLNKRLEQIGFSCFKKLIALFATHTRS